MAFELITSEENENKKKKKNKSKKKKKKKTSYPQDEKVCDFCLQNCEIGDFVNTITKNLIETNILNFKKHEKPSENKKKAKPKKQNTKKKKDKKKKNSPKSPVEKELKKNEIPVSNEKPDDCESNQSDAEPENNEDPNLLIVDQSKIVPDEKRENKMLEEIITNELEFIEVKKRRKSKKKTNEGQEQKKNHEKKYSKKSSNNSINLQSNNQSKQFEKSGQVLNKSTSDNQRKKSQKATDIPETFRKITLNSELEKELKKPLKVHLSKSKKISKTNDTITSNNSVSNIVHHELADKNTESHTPSKAGSILMNNTNNTTTSPELSVNAKSDDYVNELNHAIKIDDFKYEKCDEKSPFFARFNQDFHNFINNIQENSSHVMNLRYMILERISLIISCLFPDYSPDVRLYGSCATGLALNTSDMDIGLTGFESLHYFEIPGILQVDIFFSFYKYIYFYFFYFFFFF